MNPTFLDNMSWEMAEVYGAITDQILINLSRYFPYMKAGNVPRSAFTYQAAMLAQMGQVNQDTINIIRSNLQGVDKTLSKVLEQAIVDAVSKAEPGLLKAVKAGILKPAGIPIVAPNQMRAYTLYYQQAAQKLNLVNTVMLESTKQAYQATVADVVNRIQVTQTALDIGAGETLTGVSSWNQAMRHAIDRMKNNGITGFIDHGGHRWSAEAYTAMDIRTTVANTARAAVWETNQDFGNDLYIVSYHDGARPLCYPWQNKVISSTNNARTVTDLDGNEIHVYAQSETSYGEAAGLFGINCKHYPSPFIPGVSVLYDQSNIPSEKENEKVYEQTQQQRALERKLREEKRDLLIEKARGADEETIKELRAKCRQTSDDIDTFCEETGLPRRQNREGVFTQRDFPSADTYDVDAFERKQKDEIDKYFSNGGSQQGFVVNNSMYEKAKEIIEQEQPSNGFTLSTAKSKDELFAAIEKEYNVTVSDAVKTLNEELVKESVLGIKDITDDFPEIGQTLKGIETSKSGIMSCTGEKITFNPNYYTEHGKLEQTIERCVNSGYYFKGTTVRSIGVHEAGHGLEWFFVSHNPQYTTFSEQVDAWNKCTEAKAIVSQACKNIKQTPYGKGKVNAVLLKAISGNAADNASEALAEALSEFYTNGEKANPLSKEIARLATERYKMLGGIGNGK